MFDFAAMGLDGVEPEFQTNLRDQVLNNNVLKSIVNDMPKEAVAFATSPMDIFETAEKMIKAGEI